MFRHFAALALCCLACSAALAAPPAPPAPAVWNVEVRYRISAFRHERLKQYNEMAGVLRAAGFSRDPDEVVPDDEPENQRYTRMRGTLPEKGVRRVLAQRHVGCLLLWPQGTKLEKGKRVRVDVWLASGYSPSVQKRLAGQTASVLAKGAGFLEAVGYDRRGDTRLVGSLPVGSLEKVFLGAHTLPGAAAEPVPFRTAATVRALFARPDLPVTASQPAFPPVPAAQRKFSPELRALLGDAAAAGAPRRLEVVLGFTPAAGDRSWVRLLDVPGAAVEGRVGPLVTVLGVPKAIAPLLAEKPLVAWVRLPRAALHAPTGVRDEVPAKWGPVRASGLSRLHAAGHKGRGTRVALIADDFSGWESLATRPDGKKRVPAPVLIDLTAERRSDLRGDPMPAGAGGPGYGTRCALALLRAAPEAELVLVRIDPAAPYMLETVARSINGENVQTVALEARVREMEAERAALDRRRDQLLEERRQALDDFRGDPEPTRRRKAYQADQAAFDRQEAEDRARVRRYLALKKDLRSLRGVRLACSALVWPDGYPVDGSSPLSRHFDDRPFRAALWFQAAGDTGGQAWAGLFRDADGNGLMEFGGPDDRLPAGAWTPELNFLAWRSGGKAARDLPADAVVRLTLQWTEPHDPLPLRQGEDVYREPLTKLKLVLVYQPDPDGKGRPADDLEVVLETVGPPVRLNQTVHAATYEHVLEFRPARAGRFGVFIAGKLPESIQAAGEARLPGARRFGGLNVRLFARTLAGAGRAVWADYQTKAGTPGMPADARRVITVGSADARDRARPSSAGGPPFNLALLTKPDVYAYDGGAGTGEAAGFAAGLAASAWGSRGTLLGVLEGLQVRPGAVLRVPDRLPPPLR
jgi:hypothetical protein